MRQLILSPRWIVWHVLTLGAMATCGWLAAWQWQRAGSAMGSALNVGYGLQWPVFAVFFGVMWWRMLRMEAAKLAAQPLDEHGLALPGPVAVAEPAAHAVHTAVPRPATAADAPSPFRPAPRAATPVTEADDPELAAYNRMLAELAARTPDEPR
ncbi:hypothetical protein BJF78_36430 [Pseudonocardia sp. CNS-139]|nr:hypothetical protein BJF78_36430 [Pseudonocardia sp. CNS-139]